MAKKQATRKDNAGLFIPAGLFIGMGVGFATNSLLPGLFIGLGAGFVVFAVLKMMRKK